MANIKFSDEIEIRAFEKTNPIHGDTFRCINSRYKVLASLGNIQFYLGFFGNKLQGFLREEGDDIIYLGYQKVGLTSTEIADLFLKSYLQAKKSKKMELSEKRKAGLSSRLFLPAVERAVKDIPHPSQ